MTAKEIIKIVCYLLGLDDTASEIASSEANENFVMGEQSQKEIDRLMSCLNMTTTKIASEYIKLRAIDDLNTDSEGKIAYSSFSHSPLSFNWIDDVNGQASVRFKEMPYHLYLPIKNHAYTICYNYCPDEVVGLDDAIELPPFVSARSLAYGVCADFTLAKNLFDESKFWQTKFENEILASVSGSKNRKIRMRTFL